MEDGISYLIRCEEVANEEVEAAKEHKASMMNRAKEEAEKTVEKIAGDYEEKIKGMQEEQRDKLIQLSGEQESEHERTKKSLWSMDLEELVDKIVSKIAFD